MRVENEVVQVAGPNGGNLVGVLCEPPSGVERRNVLFILSHGGLVHKTGAYRAQQRLAQFFAMRGCSVLRFDPTGIGDSDGIVPDHANRDLFGAIESGLFIESYQCVFDYAEQRFPGHKWILSGVCGGAVSSLLAGVASKRPINGYALSSCPVVLDGSGFDYSRRAAAPLAWKMARVYAGKLASPGAIWRFLTFQVRYDRIWKLASVLVLQTKDRIGRRLTPLVGEAKTTPAVDEKPPVGLNPGFVKAAKEAMKRSEVLFIFGNNDGFLWEFNDLYAAAHLSEAQRTDVLRIVDRANHMFIWPEWQDEAFGMIDEWMRMTVDV